MREINKLIRAKGYENLIDIEGGLTANKEIEKFYQSKYVCPTAFL